MKTIDEWERYFYVEVWDHMVRDAITGEVPKFIQAICDEFGQACIEAIDKHTIKVESDYGPKYDYDDFDCTPQELKESVLNIGKTIEDIEQLEKEK